MTMNQVKWLLTRMLLVVTLLFGVVALMGTTVQAQGRQRFDRFRGQPRVFIYPRAYPRRWYWSDWYWGDRWGWYGVDYPYYYQGYFPSGHVTEGQGFHDGLDDGKDDAKHGKGNDPYRHKDYKNAVTSAYINGYLRGYAEGYR